ncbi:MAG TPA: sigma-70 family RNA polymerase sigma factor [Vicinamibacteria bacterium]
MTTLALCSPVTRQEEAIRVVADAERREAERGLVRRAQSGDLSAFEELYRSHVRRTYALCYRMAGEATLAEELTQDVFVRAWQKLSSFRGESAFGSWLHTLTVNTALSERRARRRRTSRITPTDDLEAYDGPAPVRRPEHGLDLDRAMATLPPGARQVFVLHDVEGYRHDEIAEMTGVATGTSKAQLHRARRLLRVALGRKDAES